MQAHWSGLSCGKMLTGTAWVLMALCFLSLSTTVVAWNPFPSWQNLPQELRDGIRCGIVPGITPNMIVTFMSTAIFVEFQGVGGYQTQDFLMPEDGLVRTVITELMRHFPGYEVRRVFGKYFLQNSTHGSHQDALSGQIWRCVVRLATSFATSPVTYTAGQHQAGAPAQKAPARGV